MAGRGSALTRVRQYFKTAEIDEVEVAFELVKRDIAERLAQHKRAGLAPVKTGKPRRTKAQIAADKAAMQAHAVQPKQDEASQESLANA